MCAASGDDQPNASIKTVTPVLPTARCLGFGPSRSRRWRGRRRLLRGFAGLSLALEVFDRLRGSGIGVLFGGLEPRQFVVRRLEAPFGVVLRSCESCQLVAERLQPILRGFSGTLRGDKLLLHLLHGQLRRDLRLLG